MILKSKYLLVANINLLVLIFAFFTKKTYIVSRGKYINIFFKILKKIKIDKSIFKFLNIEFIKDGSEIKNYPSLEAKSREKISKIAFEYDSSIIKSLEKILNKEAAKSFFIKGICYYSGVANYYKSYYVLTEYYKRDSEDIFCLFESETSKIIKIKPLIKLSFFKVIIRNIQKVKLVCILIMNYFFGKDNSIENEKKEFVFASEISDIKFTNKKFAEPNYLCSDNCLFYLTSQKNISSIDFNSFVNVDNFIDIRNRKLSKKSLKILFSFLTHVKHLDRENYLLIKQLFITYAEYDFLFRSFNIKNNIFLQFSNDKRYVRLDSAIVTSLANSYGARNISYQTRTPYLNDYTFYYDYFNVFFSWSRFWYSKDEISRFFNKIVPIGINNADILKQNSKKITIFTSDITTETHNTKSYNINIIEIAKQLACKYQNFQFIIKTKFEEQSKREFKDIKLSSNMKYVYGTYNLDELIDNSFLVLAMGFTSPGFQALIKGVNTIYYSELVDIENSVANFEFVAYNYDDVEKLFEKYLNKKIDIKKYQSIFNHKQKESHRDAILDYLKSYNNA